MVSELRTDPSRQVSVSLPATDKAGVPKSQNIGKGRRAAQQMDQYPNETQKTKPRRRLRSVSSKNLSYQEKSDENAMASDDSTVVSSHSQKSADANGQNANSGECTTSSQITGAVQKLPERQRSAMEAFLTSPTGLNWDDLVRSMREELLVQVITIQKNKSSDSSSSSLGSGSGDKSSKSLASSLSSRSLKRVVKKGIKSKKKNEKGRRKVDSLEKQVEKVLAKKGKAAQQNRNESDDSYPLLRAAKRSTPSAARKLPTIPCSPLETERRASGWEDIELVAHITSGDQSSSPSPSRLPTPSVHTINSGGSSTVVSDPPLQLPASHSGESDEDSFYYQIRGAQRTNNSSDNSVDDEKSSLPRQDVSNTMQKNKFVSSSKTRITHKEPKNPYAFPNHPMLPIVLEEKQPFQDGHISPFPTQWDHDENYGKASSKQQLGFTIRPFLCDDSDPVATDARLAPRIKKAAAQFSASSEATAIAETSQAKVKKYNGVNDFRFTALSESPSFDEKGPTCWQVLRRRCRGTKASF